jgi:hypothetical protein
LTAASVPGPKEPSIARLYSCNSFNIACISSTTCPFWPRLATRPAISVSASGLTCTTPAAEPDAGGGTATGGCAASALQTETKQQTAQQQLKQVNLFHLLTSTKSFITNKVRAQRIYFLFI